MAWSLWYANGDIGIKPYTNTDAYFRDGEIYTVGVTDVRGYGVTLYEVTFGNLNTRIKLTGDSSVSNQFQAELQTNDSGDQSAYRIYYVKYKLGSTQKTYSGSEIVATWDGNPKVSSIFAPEGSPPVIENYEVPETVLESFSFEVSAIVTDIDGDLDEVYFQFNGTDYPAYQAGSQYRRTLYAPSVASNTDYDVVIVATDLGYNTTTESQTVKILGSANAPSFSNISIPSEVDEGKTFNISVVVTDADGDLSTVKVTWNGSTDAMSASGSTYSKTLTAPSVSEDTTYSCVIVATDAAGNTATLTYSINVRNIRAVDVYSYIDICCNKYVSQGEVYAIRTDGRLFTIENNVSPTAVALPSGSDGWSVKQTACGDEFQIVRAEVLWSS